MSIIIFIIILALLVLTHELGHFLLAKKNGVRVDEFGLGFPPRLWGIKKGETLYSINAIPFGGFVKIFGEDPDADSIEGVDSGRSLVNKSKKVQGVILAGGVFFNILLAWFLLTIGFTLGLPVSESSAPAGSKLINSEIVINDVLKNSPAEQAGLKPGDRVLAATFGLEKIVSPATTDLQKFLGEKGGQVVDLTVKKNSGSDKGQIVNLKVTPKASSAGERAMIGISMDKVGVLKLPFYQAIYEGLSFTISTFYLTAVAFFNLIVGAFQGGPVLDSVTGPIGLATIVGNTASLGFSYLLSFTAVISLNLAVLNLIPFPALDGGRIFVLFIEWVRGRRIKPEIINTVNMVGFGLLLLLMAVVTYKDIARIVVG